MTGGCSAQDVDPPSKQLQMATRFTVLERYFNAYAVIPSRSSISAIFTQPRTPDSDISKSFAT